MKRATLTLLVLAILPLASYASIEISTDHRPLTFSVMQLGEEKELAQVGAYHNQVTCSSTNGITWYLKISVLQPLTSGQDSIPLENFKWQLVWTNGTGSIASHYQFKPFSLFPDIVYMSGPNEAAGNTINFQFKYYLKIPDAQINGVYSTTIRYTLTEIL